MSAQPSPHFVQFVLDDQRYELRCQTTPEALAAFMGQLEKSHREDFWGVVQDLKHGPVTSAEEAQKEGTSAEEMLRYLVEEGLMASMGVVPPALWVEARELDAEVAASVEPATAYEVAFVWNNGGGDDNVFGWTLLGLAEPASTYAWAEALGRWLEDAGHGYDLSIGPLRPDEADMDLADAVEDLVDTLSENGQDTWGQAMMEALKAPVKAQPSRARPRVG